MPYDKALGVSAAATGRENHTRTQICFRICFFAFPGLMYYYFGNGLGWIPAPCFVCLGIATRHYPVHR